MKIKESNKFPAVMTTQNVLGIEEGTILKFDWASGKYVSVSEEEDIAEDYFYSGYALALDPYLVKDNIGTFFTFIEQEEDLDTTIEHVVTKEDLQLNPGEDLKEGEKVDLPKDSLFSEYTKINTLVVDCNCGHRHILGTVPAPGIQFTVMAEDETSFIEMGCPECDSTLKIWFAPSNEDIGDEPTQEESK